MPSIIRKIPAAGTRQVPFSRELFIDSADFMETPPPKYFRLKPGGEVRLKYAYIIKCNEVVKDVVRQRQPSCAARLIWRANRAARLPIARSKARSIG